MSSPFTDHYISYSDNDLASETPCDVTEVSSPFYKTFQNLISFDNSPSKDDKVMNKVPCTRKYSQMDDSGIMPSQSPSLIRTPQPLFDNKHLNFALDQAFRPALLERTEANKPSEETEHSRRHNSIHSQSRAIKKLSEPARTSLMMTGREMAQTVKKKRVKKGYADPEQRAITNRVSAQRSIDNKNNRIKELEAMCSTMAEENKKLIAEKSGMSVAFRNLMVAYSQLSQSTQAQQLPHDH